MEMDAVDLVFWLKEAELFEQERAKAMRDAQHG